VAKAGPFYVATGKAVLIIEAHSEGVESFIEFVVDGRAGELVLKWIPNARRKEVEAYRLA
jgi:hypothetical protein